MKFTTTYTTDNYDIIVQKNALNLAIDFSKYHHCYALIDSKVYEYHKVRINKFLSRHNIEKILLPAGEPVKTMFYYEQFCELLLEKNIKRNDCLIAIGGGATGDFTGFLAATLLRGLSFIQVPTTILAHDAAIGGKTGINAKVGKNLIGAFKRPDCVIYDMSFLSTLSQQERLSGFAEIIKHVFLNGDYIINTSDKLLNHEFIALTEDFTCIQSLRDTILLEKWLSYGIQTKLNIVVQDELEVGVRKYLNFGHTLGHALEFVHKLPHGIAVLHGMMFALLLSGYEPGVVKSIYKWASKLGYESITLQPFDIYLQYMKKDKKNDNDLISFVVMKQIKSTHVNEVFEVKSFDQNTLIQCYERWSKIMRSCYDD